MRVILTPEDLKKGDLVPPGWYPAEIVDYKEEEAIKDKSTNCYFVMKVNDPEQFRGVSPRVMFNEKAMGYGKELWSTLELPKDASGNYELSTELFRKTIGFKMEVYIERGVSDKKNEFNNVKSYRPLGTGKK